MIIKVGMRNEYKMETFPGLFVYSGFGVGTYYGVDRVVNSATRSEARRYAEEDGVEHVYQDSFCYPTRGKVD